ncbi:MAG: hypothetical protein WCA38_06590 [Candidatus Acidiferrales bacterium]
MSTQWAFATVEAVKPSPNLDPANRRRSKRVKKRIALRVRMQGGNKQTVAEETHTIIVNDHGALILLATPVSVNQIIRLENLDSKEELLCRVTSLGQNFMGKSQIGVEFIYPAPAFWESVLPSRESKNSRNAAVKVS